MSDRTDPVVVVVVGSDAAALGALAEALRREHGLQAAVFVTDPVSGDEGDGSDGSGGSASADRAEVAGAVAALAAELAAAPRSGN